MTPKVELRKMNFTAMDERDTILEHFS